MPFSETAEFAKSEFREMQFSGIAGFAKRGFREMQFSGIAGFAKRGPREMPFSEIAEFAKRGFREMQFSGTAGFAKRGFREMPFSGIAEIVKHGFRERPFAGIAKVGKGRSRKKQNSPEIRASGNGPLLVCACIFQNVQKSCSLGARKMGSRGARFFLSGGGGSKGSNKVENGKVENGKVFSGAQVGGKYSRRRASRAVLAHPRKGQGANLWKSSGKPKNIRNGSSRPQNAFQAVVLGGVLSFRSRSIRLPKESWK